MACGGSGAAAAHGRGSDPGIAVGTGGGAGGRGEWEAWSTGAVGGSAEVAGWSAAGRIASQAPADPSAPRKKGRKRRAAVQEATAAPAVPVAANADEINPPAAAALETPEVVAAAMAGDAPLPQYLSAAGADLKLAAANDAVVAEPLPQSRRLKHKANSARWSSSACVNSSRPRRRLVLPVPARLPAQRRLPATWRTTVRRHLPRQT